MDGFITADGADYIMSVAMGIEEVLPEYFVALVTQPVGASESGDELYEPITADYSRAAIANNSDAWSVAYGTATNQVEVALPVPGLEAWAGIVGWALCDAETGGRVLYAGSTDTYDVAIGDQTFLPAGAISLSIELDGWRENT